MQGLMGCAQGFHPQLRRCDITIKLSSKWMEGRRNLIIPTTRMWKPRVREIKRGNDAKWRHYKNSHLQWREVTTRKLLAGLEGLTGILMAGNRSDGIYKACVGVPGGACGKGQTGSLQNHKCMACIQAAPTLRALVTESEGRVWHASERRRSSMTQREPNRAKPERSVWDSYALENPTNHSDDTHTLVSKVCPSCPAELVD